jgi:hypothetical protein
MIVPLALGLRTAAFLLAPLSDTLRFASGTAIQSHNLGTVTLCFMDEAGCRTWRRPAALFFDCFYDVANSAPCWSALHGRLLFMAWLLPVHLSSLGAEDRIAAPAARILSTIFRNHLTPARLAAISRRV